MSCVDNNEPLRKGECNVLSEKKIMLAGLMIGLTTLMATPAFASSISLKGVGGVAFWIFIIVGAILVLLQLIPAIVLFLSFVARKTYLSQRRRLQKK